VRVRAYCFRNCTTELASLTERDNGRFRSLARALFCKAALIA